MCDCKNKLPPKDVLKNRHFEKSCSAFMIKKFKKVPVKAFHFSGIISPKSCNFTKQ